VNNLKLDIEFIQALSNELDKARTKFPNNKHQLAALSEEFGEVANALLERDYCDSLPLEHNRHVWNECAQAAAMCMRVAVEGDASFKYEPPYKDSNNE